MKQKKQSREKSTRSSVRVTLTIPKRQLKIYNMLENKSKFLQIALDDATGIMTWALMRENHPEKYHVNHPPIEEVIPKFNAHFPIDSLSATRKDVSWPENSAQNPELW